jgi:hypothetical protein
MKLIVRLTSLTLSITLLALAIGHLMMGPARAGPPPRRRRPTRRGARLRRRWPTSCTSTP